MTYLQWLAQETKTEWWNDSGDPAEIEQALANGAVGVTTNPVLCAQALAANREAWRGEIQDVLARESDPRARAEALMRIVVVHAARRLSPLFESTAGEKGYVCAQVDPTIAGSRQAMYDMALRLSAWAPNVTVKLPATAAGLDVMERCCSQGVAITVTVSFSVSQVLAAGARHHRLVRSRRGGAPVGRCFPVIMIGRIDDYLREVSADGQAPVSEQEIQAAGLAVVKRAYRLFRERGYEAKLLVAALRGTYHMTALAGGSLVMSVHPGWQKSLLEPGVQREEGIDRPVPPEALARLRKMPEFVRSFAPRGLSELEMLPFGPTQRTISQFIETGWRKLEQLK